MKFLTTLVVVVLALAGCAGTPTVNGLMGPGDTLLIRSRAPLFDHVGSLSHRSGLVVAERGRDQLEVASRIQTAR